MAYRWTMVTRSVPVPDSSHVGRLITVPAPVAVRVGCERRGEPTVGHPAARPSHVKLHHA